jgi:hypothetical protein
MDYLKYSAALPTNSTILESGLELSIFLFLASSRYQIVVNQHQNTKKSIYVLSGYDISIS